MRAKASVFYVFVDDRKACRIMPIYQNVSIVKALRGAAEAYTRGVNDGCTSMDSSSIQEGSKLIRRMYDEKMEVKSMIILEVFRK